MLNRTAATTPMPRIAWDALRALRKGLMAGPNAWLFQMVLLAFLACLLTCAYLWQSSAISDIESDTQDIMRQSKALERSNVALMVQLAKWEHPAYIERMAKKQGMMPAQPPLVLQVPIQAAQAGSTDFLASSIAGLWQGLGDRLTVSPAMARLPIWTR